MRKIIRSIHLLRNSTWLALVGSTLLSGSAWAQPQEEGGEDGADGTNEGDPGGDGGGDGSMQPRMDDVSEPRPEPPGGTALDGNFEDPKVVRGAGMGSDKAYAMRGVVELGGSFGLDIRDEVTDFVAAPTVGYFVTNRVELSLIPVFRVQNVGDPDSDADQTNVRLAAILEPSYHLPLTDVFYVFAGFGLGLTYEEGPGVDFLIRPVAGLDIMVGRSGIFKPSGFVDVGVDDGVMGGGFLAGYTVMF